MRYPDADRHGPSIQFEHPGQNIFFMDIETTGLEPSRHEIIVASVGCHDHETGNLIAEIELEMRPEYSEWASSEAERINGISRLEALFFPDRKEQLTKLVEFFEENQGPGNPLFCFHALNYYGNFFDWLMLTTNAHDFGLEQRIRTVFRDGYLRSTVTYAQEARKRKRIQVDDCKLPTLCILLNIKLEHHKAKSDRVACKEIYYFLRGLWEIV